MGTVMDLGREVALYAYSATGLTIGLSALFLAGHWILAWTVRRR